MFGENLKQYRRNKKIKQIEIAEALNVSQGTIANWEAGLRSPNIDMLPTIADYLGVSIDNLFGRGSKSISLSNAEKHLLKAYNNADAHAQQYALDMLVNHPAEEKERRA